MYVLFYFGSENRPNFSDHKKKCDDVYDERGLSCLFVIGSLAVPHLR